MSGRAQRGRRERAERAGKRRRGPKRESPAAASSPKPAAEEIRARDVAVLAAALALAGGFLEVGEVLYVIHRGLTARQSQHYPWMIPAAHLLAYTLVAAFLLAVRRFWPRARSRAVAVGVLVGLLTLAVVGILEPLYSSAVLVLAVGAGVQAGRLARGRFGGWLLRVARPTAAITGGAFLVVLVASFVAPRRAEQRALAQLPAAAPGRPNILLIVMDAVRAPSMGLYNPSLANTPELNALAAQSTVFNRAASVTSWTLPSHATLFTGRWPTEHGADWNRTLDDIYPTLAERLSRAGYATAGFTGNLVFTGHEQGLARGFSRYEDYPLNLAQVVLSASLGRRLANLNRPRRWIGLTQPLNEVPGEEVTDRFLRWRDRHPDRPFFVFMNYYDAHEPFRPAPGGPPITPLVNHNTLKSGTTSHFRVPAPEEEGRFLEGYRAGYEAAIDSIDGQVRRVVLALDGRGELDNTIVVVTADHGDVIGEHRLVGHNSSLYLPVLWVPLLIRYPAAVPAGVRVEQEVTQRNLPATLLALAGVDPEEIPGRSLARYWTAEHPGDAGRDTLYAHLSHGAGLPAWAPAARGREMYSLIQDHRHYILNGDGTEDLYDLDRDAAEARNLAADSATAGLRARFRAVLQSLPGVNLPPGGGEDPGS